MNVTQLLDRARSATSIKVVYKLGAGGMNPDRAHPGAECDCSGFVCWALGRSRKTNHPLYVKFNQGWINTDAMVKDAMECAGFFTLLALPRPGCLVVYPGHNSYRQIGHVGIVTEVSAENILKVIHCSNGNYRRTGQAIQETGPAVFRVPDVVYAWYEGLNA